MSNFRAGLEDIAFRRARSAGQFSLGRIRLSETDIVNGDTIAHMADDETVTGTWTFNQNIVWKSGTSFKGTLDHSNTADRTYTYPDETGTVTLKERAETISGAWVFNEDIVWKSGTGFTGSQRHNNTANRTYDYPDESGTVSLLERAETVTGQWKFTQDLHWESGAGFLGRLRHANTAARDYDFPDQSGTIALLERNENVTGAWTFSAAVTLAEGVNIVLGTVTGTKIGTSTSQLLGFYNATPVVQRSDFGALTDSTTGTAGNTINDVGGAFNQATLNNNFASLTDRINDIRTVLRDLGLMA